MSEYHPVLGRDPSVDGYSEVDPIRAIPEYMFKRFLVCHTCGCLVHRLRTLDHDRFHTRARRAYKRSKRRYNG